MQTRGVVDVVAASLHLAPQVVASTEDLIVHVLVEGRELSEADLALPPPLQQTQVPRLSGSDATALGNKESAAAGTSAREDMNLSNDNNGSLQSGTSTAQARPPPRMGRLLDSMVSKLANRLLSDAQDLPAALHQLQRDLPLKLDRVQVCVCILYLNMMDAFLLRCFPFSSYIYLLFVIILFLPLCTPTTTRRRPLSSSRISPPPKRKFPRNLPPKEPLTRWQRDRCGACIYNLSLGYSARVSFDLHFRPVTSVRSDHCYEPMTKPPHFFIAGAAHC
jgi:hypothetical protein